MIKKTFFMACVGFGMAACAGQVNDGGSVQEEGESLSSFNQRIIGGYQNTDGKGHYALIALKDDGTYIGLTGDAQERGEYAVYKPWFECGQLTVTPTDPPGDSALYCASRAWFGGGLTLTIDGVKAHYQLLSTGYCGIDTDCNGQPFTKNKVTCTDPQQGPQNVCTPQGTCQVACVDQVPPMGPPVPPPGAPQP